MANVAQGVRTEIRTIWRLGWPLAITLQLVGFSDAIVLFWLGQLIGPSGIAIHATLRYAFLCATWVMVGVATGVSVLVSQSVGARDGRGMSIIANGIALSVVIWAAALVVVMPLAGPISDHLASRDVSAVALRSYFVPWLLMTLSGIGVVQVLLQAASGAGWTRLSLVRALTDLVLIAGVVPVLVAVAGFGVTGAPIADALVQTTVALLLWRTLWRRRERWGLGEAGGWRSWFDGKLWRHVLDIGMPPQLARIAMLGSYAYFAQRIASDGKTAIAAFGIALTLMFFGFSATSAIGRASAIVVGQSIGARDWGRVSIAVRAGLWLAGAMSVGFILALVLLGGPLASLFTDDRAVIDQAAAALPIFAIAIPFAAISQVFLNVLTALEASKAASAAGVFADAVGVAFVVVAPGDRLDNVAWSIVLSNGLRALMFTCMWRWGMSPELTSRARDDSSPA